MHTHAHPILARLPLPLLEARMGVLLPRGYNVLVLGEFELLTEEEEDEEDTENEFTGAVVKKNKKKHK